MNVDNLERRVRQSKLFVTAVTIIVPLTYILWFWFANNDSISNDSEKWGQLGDFIGGIANPIIAYFAFYWLATSVLIQKTELVETRKSLEASQRAQEEQAKTVLISTKLQYLNINLETLNSQINAESSYVNQLTQQSQIHGSMYTITTRSGDQRKLNEVLPELNRQISTLSKRRDLLISQAEIIAPDLAIPSTDAEPQNPAP